MVTGKNLSRNERFLVLLFLNFLTFLSAFAVLILPNDAMASVPKMSPTNPSKLLNQNSKKSIEMIGGTAGSLFTILDVRKSSDAKKRVERIVIDLGDKDGQAIRGDVGFYHAELQENPARLIIDLAQTPQSKLTFAEVQKRLSQSITIQKSTVFMDPVTNNTSLTIDLRPGTKARVFPVKGVKQTSKIVIDLIAQ